MDARGRDGGAGKGCVLIVDDNEFFRKMQSLLLTKAGYRVLTAGDGLEALEHLPRLGCPISIVITDLMMPRMDGMELCSQLRALGIDVPVVLVTGTEHPQCFERPGDFGFDAALAKPIEPHHLIELVASLLRTHGASAEGAARAAGA